MSIRMLVLLLVGMVALQADDLITRDGKVYKGYSVLSHDTGYLTIMYADGGGKIPLSDLPTELQKAYGYDAAKSDSFVQQDKATERKERADLGQTELAAAQIQEAEAVKQRAARQQLMAAQRVTTQVRDAAGPAVADQTVSGIAEKFTHSLITSDNGIRKMADPTMLAGVKYLAFYYSASWCPPCRAFTPSLVSFYREFKPTHPTFELIFVNEDQTEDDMMAYMKTDGMTWPAVRFDELRDPDARRYAGTGIPDLVLVNLTGKVLSDSFENGTYVGPEHVMDDIRKMVR